VPLALRPGAVRGRRGDAHAVDVVVRGQGAGHARTSLPTALHARLPDRGTTMIAGQRFVVHSLTRTALGGELVKIWVLVPTCAQLRTTRLSASSPS
jgi:hypothetical protein